TFNGASAVVATNTYVAGPITVLNSAAQGARRTFSFTPPAPNPPSALQLTATQVSETLQWTDSLNASFYAIYRSTDGFNYAFETTVAQNSTSYTANSLIPGTTYSWRVFAVSAEGALSTALAGSKATV